MSGDVDVVEALQFQRPFEYHEDGVKKEGNKMMRVIAIKNHEELMCWEILNDAKGDQYFRNANSQRLSTFRWPFFAYCSS